MDVMDNLDIQKILEMHAKECFNELVRYRNLYFYVQKVVSYEGKFQLADFLSQKGYQKLIIYGSGLMGKLAYDVLKTIENIDVIGFIDKNQNSDYGINNFISIEDAWKADCIVVTPLSSAASIKAELHKKGITHCYFLLEMIETKEIKKIYENGIFI